MPFCDCNGVAFLGLSNPRQRPAHMLPNTAQRRCPGKAGCSWQPMLSGLLSQESGEPGKRSPSMELSVDLGKLACRSVGRRDKAAVSGAGSRPWGPPGSLLHITWFSKNYVLVPTSHLITFFLQGNNNFFTLLHGIGTSGSQGLSKHLLIDFLIESSLCIEGQHWRDGAVDLASHPVSSQSSGDHSWGARA